MPTALEIALFEYLSDDVGVSELVDDRIYPTRLPEGTILPAISWNRVSASRLYTYDSFEETDAWVRARVQFNCWAVSAEAAMRVGEAVLLALSGYDGDMSGQPIGSSFNVLEMDQYETGSKLYRRVLDFFISYEDNIEIGS